MKAFIVTRLLTTSSLFGLILILVGVFGALPLLGWGFSGAAVLAGLGLIFGVKGKISATDIHDLDPALDKIVGDKVSASIQDTLIKLLVAQGEDPATATQKATEAVKKLDSGTYQPKPQ